MSERLPIGGAWIDRSRPVRFTFDGVEHSGFEGDTLASALLGNGIVGGFRSPILGRPRGVMTAGPDEPNAFVEVSAPWFDPIVAATMVDLVDGLVAESRAGVGRLPAEPKALPRPRVEHRHAHVELLVIGGHEGRNPAEEAARRGDRVLVVEQLPTLPGAGSARRPEGVTFLTRATVLGLYDDGYAIVHERRRPVERIWHVRAGRVVLATGTRDRSIAFADNDRPGVMLSSAAIPYLLYGVAVGRRAVAFGARPNPGALEILHNEAGVEVTAVVDLRPHAHLPRTVAGPELLAGWTVAGTEGDPALTAVRLRGPEGERRTLGCDVLLVSGGIAPNLDLWRAVGGTLRYDEERACFLPDAGPTWLSVVGSAAGEDLGPGVAYPLVPGEDLSRHFVDLQRDQTVADVAAALDAGLTSTEHVKRATYIGTAIDQGRTSAILAAEVVNALLGAAPGAQGPTNARPPAVPVSFAVLAGPYRGELLDAVRTTPIHHWHLTRGARFEDAGQWKRPWCFPQDGDGFEDAVARECLAVRTAVGVLDASTLGKIEVIGPDAAAFLDRMYTNRMSDLPVGRIRYGLMLGLDGMVADDGVAMRVSEDRYFVTTTTGNAAMVLDRFEEWLQTEWPELRVLCTSVTEQWADVAVAGPRARDVLAAAGTDLDLSREAFPFMTFRDGVVAGVPARVARVSFTGELSFEILVPARFGLYVWETVLTAGEPFGIAPYGTEAMHVLRAEKGFVIVGQETDGTVTPHDLGMGWIVNLGKGDFVGRRSLSRPDLVRPDRKQLVGVLPDDPEELLPEGAQVVLEDTGRIPMTTAGHVTSSYRSPTLGRTFALALLARGRELHGRTVFAPLGGRIVPATVSEPVSYDPEGARRDG